MNPLYIAAAVAIVMFILYTLDRKSKGEPIAWDSALKFGVFGALIGGGVSFVAKGGEIPIPEALPEIPLVQEMFVGNPTF